MRQRLPTELWPPLLLDPYHAADETVSLHDTPSIRLEYDGRHRESLPRQLAAAEGRIPAADGHVCVYDDAEVVGRRPLVGVNGRYFPPSWLGVDTAFFVHQEKYLRRNLPTTWSLQQAILDSRPERSVDTGFLLLGERSHEFPAWHHEVLPKLRWLEEYEQATGESPTLIVSADLTSFHEKSLQLMGYDPDSWVESDDDGIQVGRLVIPPHPLRAKGTHLHTSPHDWVADRILSNVSAPTAGFSDRIYISRQDADRRHIENEKAVRDALAEIGFEWYEPGRLSYEEEVQLFAGAEHIVGAHGKGLASMFYAEDATLLELFPERGGTEHYFLTAHECGFEYDFLTGEPIPAEQNIRPRDRDFVVDIDTLRSRVSNLVDPAKPDPIGP
jgi:hypothetical protein